MNTYRIIHFFAGTMVLTGLLLGHFVHENWLWLSAFVGANLLQFSLTKFCPLKWFLNKMGVKDEPSCNS